MVFEIGKYYKHTAGDRAYVCGRVDSTFYGKNTLMGEVIKGGYFFYGALGQDEAATINWKEITREEFLEGFPGEVKNDV